MINNIIYNLIKNYSNIWYGIGIAIILIVLLYGIIQTLRNNRKFSILSFAFGLILIPFLSFQMSRLYGAIDLYCDLDYMINMTSSINQIALSGMELPEVNGITGFTQEMLDKAYTYLNWYIIRRVLWSMLFIALAGVGIYKFMTEKDYGGRNFSNRHDRVSLRHSQTSSRNHRYH